MANAMGPKKSLAMVLSSSPPPPGPSTFMGVMPAKKVMVWVVLLRGEGGGENKTH
jgi:hypothetical protein